MLADAPLGVLLEGFVRLSTWPGLPNSVAAFAFFLFALFWLWGPRLFFFEGINTSLKTDNKQRDCFNVDFESLPGMVAQERAEPRLESCLPVFRALARSLRPFSHCVYLLLLSFQYLIYRLRLP